MKLLCTAGLTALFLTGCASTSIVMPARPANSDEAVFYVIRKDYPPTAWTGDLTVNKVVTATLRDNTYVKVNVPTGSAAIALEFAPLLGFSNEPFSLEVKPHETRYLLLTGDVSFAGIAYDGVKLKWSLKALELEASAAQKIMDTLPAPAN